MKHIIGIVICISVAFTSYVGLKAGEVGINKAVKWYTGEAKAQKLASQYKYVEIMMIIYTGRTTPKPKVVKVWL
jgi:hypothetical protein